MTTFLRTSTLLVATLAVSLGSALPAYACSGTVTGLVNQRLVFPRDGASNVPTNAQVVLLLKGTSLDMGDAPGIVDAQQTAVPVTILSIDTRLWGPNTIKTYVVKPNAPLQPNTRYQVVSTMPTVPCQTGTAFPLNPPVTFCKGSGTDGGVALSAIAAFTTAAGPDTTPPTLDGSLTATPEPKQICTNSACCGPYTGYPVIFRWQPSPEPATGVIYEIARDGTPVLPLIPSLFDSVSTVGNTMAVTGGFLCSGTSTTGLIGMSFAEFVGVPGEFSVVAVDWAGNRSAPLAANVALDCPVPDAGATDVALPSDAGLLTPLDVRPIKPDVSISPDVPASPSDTVVVANPDVLPPSPDAGAAPIPDAQGARDVPITGPDRAIDASPSSKNDASSGCSCDVRTRSTSAYPFFALFALFALSGRRRRGR